MTNIDIEACAAAEHESWSGWTKWMLEQIEKEVREVEDVHDTLWDDQTVPHTLAVLSKLPCVQRWTRQMNTPYAELSEKEKESDRVEVRKKLEVYHALSPEAREAARRFIRGQQVGQG